MGFFTINVTGHPFPAFGGDVNVWVKAISIETVIKMGSGGIPESQSTYAFASFENCGQEPIYHLTVCFTITKP
jgi:hypothetical protein